ncbi:MAG: imidazolonepropionase [Pelomonas sp.]|nr:imidazolonepropionase [Roseateles sp.]
MSVAAAKVHAVDAAPQRVLWRHARIASFAADTGWGLIDAGAILTEGDRIAWVGAEAELAPQDVAAERSLGGALVTPGLIDAHTHLVYGGDRAREFEMRLEGATYEQIAKAGGGIRSTVAATRMASELELRASAQARLDALIREGVTTVEIKSGYGLSLESERRCLEVARALRGACVRTTYLGAHAVPPEFHGRPDDYVDLVIGWMPELRDAGLIDAVDAFCESIGFTPEQTRRVFAAARELELPVKLHAEQLSDQGGAQLACEFGALSCDHLEHVSPAGIDAMRRSGTVALLLPGAYYFLRETALPPIAALREAGVPIAIATDHNPGTSPTLSPLLMLNMACTLFRMTPEEALRGLTVNAARALGLPDRGRLSPGLRADFCAWDAGHPNELAYYFGRNPLRERVFGGVAS